jgi:[ribosomal protein S5]-alanine N-acetyltransferase
MWQCSPRTSDGELLSRIGMHTLHLIPIEQAGQPAEPCKQDEFLRACCEMTATHYQRVGFQPPWIGYLARENDRIVGVCGFKGAPIDGRVEIAYGAVPGHEGRGVATQLARQLIDIALQTRADVSVMAQTLPQDSASTSILKKLGLPDDRLQQQPPIRDQQQPSRMVCVNFEAQQLGRIIAANMPLLDDHPHPLEVLLNNCDLGFKLLNQTPRKRAHKRPPGGPPIYCTPTPIPQVGAKPQFDGIAYFKRPFGDHGWLMNTRLLTSRLPLTSPGR